MQAAGSNTENKIVPTQTVSVHGIPSGMLEDDVLQDLLTIHFQKAKNGGGDVKRVIYPTRVKGVAYVTFEDYKVAERVLQKKGQILVDRRLPTSFQLKVARYGEHIFACAAADLDLSPFCKCWPLKEVVKELQERVPDLSFGSLTSHGHISVEGPFPAIKLLRDVLLHTYNMAQKGCDCLSERDRGTPNATIDSMEQESGSHLESSLSFSQESYFESQTLIIDTDVYLFMIKVLKKEFQERLSKYNITCDETREDGITMLTLKAVASDPKQVADAKKEIQVLSDQLQSTLRKERIHLDDTNECQSIDKCIGMKPMFPMVLIVPYRKYIDLIGPAADVAKFMQASKDMSPGKDQDGQIYRSSR
ncbi:RNA-binding protein 43-like isoform X2 [Ambystoma mexicanum]|uniref:RNA-binding protein 43-like isoform X2 n=1 Tax=Ambystoma mexicanum TaxID=8296 RepID=UPI0037E7D3E3